MGPPLDRTFSQWQSPPSIASLTTPSQVRPTSKDVPQPATHEEGVKLSVSAVRQSLLSRAPFVAALLSLLALLATTSIGAATVHAASNNSPRTASTAAADASPHKLKAVFIVGPTNALTSSNLTDAEQLAVVAESYGMDVRRVFFPHATWANVLANIQGANLVVYMGHGYGWPSPYTATLTESRQDGMGLNTVDGSSASQFTYYGANLLRQYVTLAPNAIVFLNHLCYSAGNAEPGMAFPTWDVARQRVDNMASGWLGTGAKAVFAYGEQLFVKTLRGLMDATVDESMEDLFRLAPPTGKLGEYWGWVGADPRKFDSVRTPGATNFLDPDPTKDGWYRAVTGNLSMTASQWKSGPDSPAAPNLRNLGGGTDGTASLVGSNGLVFTPNGDGLTDTVSLSYTTDKETFVDWQVQNSSGTVVRTFTSWAAGGRGTAVWNGKRDDGSYVSDGTYTITATPSSRAGNVGGSSSVDVAARTAMKSPTLSPSLFYAADGDGLAPSTNMTVTLTQPATFSWTVVDKNNNVVRTNVVGANLGAGAQSWRWDGKNDAATYVPDGTYYSVMTAATSAGAYTQRVAIDVKAFRLMSAVPAPFVRGTKVKFTIYSAETLSSLTPKPKLRVTLPGLAVKVYATTKQADGGFYVTVNFPTTAQAGTALFRVTGTDANAVAQYTDYSFNLN
jgi:flagellar hook assembly protein FlgD